MNENVAKRVILAFGGPTKAAKALGMAISTVDSWQRNGRIPDWRRASIITVAERDGVTLPREFLMAKAA